MNVVKFLNICAYTKDKQKEKERQEMIMKKKYGR